MNLIVDSLSSSAWLQMITVMMMTVKCECMVVIQQCIAMVWWGWKSFIAAPPHRRHVMMTTIMIVKMMLVMWMKVLHCWLPPSQKTSSKQFKDRWKETPLRDQNRYRTFRFKLLCTFALMMVKMKSRDYYDDHGKKKLPNMWHEYVSVVS